ncbi:MAG: hypothetical protein WCG80_17175 [Spirochaetales bacterium]
MSEAICYSLLFADRVIREDNGKTGIIGSFSQFNFPSFPAPITFPWVVFFAIANLRGKHTISMNLVHDDTQSVVFPISMEIDAPGDVNLEITIPAPIIILPKPGDYSLTLNVDGFPLCSRILKVSKVDVLNG